MHTAKCPLVHSLHHQSTRHHATNSFAILRKLCRHEGAAGKCGLCRLSETLWTGNDEEKGARGIHGEGISRRWKPCHVPFRRASCGKGKSILRSLRRRGADCDRILRAWKYCATVLKPIIHCENKHIVVNDKDMVRSSMTATDSAALYPTSFKRGESVRWSFWRRGTDRNRIPSA